LERNGTIIRALSGFYYVRCDSDTIVCRAKGRFRNDGLTPLVGDRVTVEAQDDGTGTVSRLHPRKNCFGRPAVANVDALVMLASEAIPVTDPYLIDRVTVRCEKNGVQAAVVVNKCDLTDGARLKSVYENAGYPAFCVSAATGEGVPALREWLSGKTVCFTGNSGVGKSSLLNTLAPGLAIPTAEVSQKLGRGRHTTRHVELFALGGDTYIADTPGFASFGDETEEPIRKGELAGLFPEFAPYRDTCRFDDCTHRREPGCEVRAAAEAGVIARSRYASYLRLFEEAAQLKEWELAKKQ